MQKQDIKYIAVLVLVLTAAILFEAYKPKPVDWEKTFSNRDKIPYGTYVLYSALDELFPNQEITVSRIPAYNVLQQDTLLQANYIFIAPSFYSDDYEVDELLDFVSKGNSVFIATQMFWGTLLDTLHLSVNDTMMWQNKDSLVVFSNPQLNSHPYGFESGYFHFFEPDSISQATILGKNGDGQPNFVRIGYGGGNVYLNLLPEAFTNYYVLNDSTSDYAFKALSYLPPDRPVIWDEYANQGRDEEESILRVLMSFPSLRWAYYIAIFGVLLYVIFEGKRRQRIIPVIQPLKNTTLEFLDVVSRLYFQKRDHIGIAQKKSIFFLEQIRTKYHLKTNQLDENFAITLSQKAGYPLEKTKYLIWKINQINRQSGMTDLELIRFDRELEDFNQRQT